MKKHDQTVEDIGSLVNLLESQDDKVRRKARKSLVVIGKPAVPTLSEVLQNSSMYKARWEAAKAIPSLVWALQDSETDVVWLAAEALKKFKKAAWPEILNVLIKQGAKSVTLRNAFHHVFRKQRENGFNDLLEILRKALESDTVPESTPLAAYKILERMSEHSNHN